MSGLSLPIPVTEFLNLCDFLINLWEKGRREGENVWVCAWVSMHVDACRTQGSTSGLILHVPPTLFFETVYFIGLWLTTQIKPASHEPQSSGCLYFPRAVVIWVLGIQRWLVKVSPVSERYRVRKEPFITPLYSPELLASEVAFGGLSSGLRIEWIIRGISMLYKLRKSQLFILDFMGKGEGPKIGSVTNVYSFTP